MNYNFKKSMIDLSQSSSMRFIPNLKNIGYESILHNSNYFFLTNGADITQNAYRQICMSDYKRRVPLEI